MSIHFKAILLIAGVALFAVASWHEPWIAKGLMLAVTAVLVYGAALSCFNQAVPDNEDRP